MKRIWATFLIPPPPPPAFSGSFQGLKNLIFPLYRTLGQTLIWDHLDQKDDSGVDNKPSFPSSWGGGTLLRTPGSLPGEAETDSPRHGGNGGCICSEPSSLREGWPQIPLPSSAQHVNTHGPQGQPQADTDTECQRHTTCTNHLFPALGLYKLARYRCRTHWVLQYLYLKRMLLRGKQAPACHSGQPLPGEGLVG